MDRTNQEVTAEQNPDRRRYADGCERESVRLIAELIRSDSFRMNVLEQVRRLHLPDCWVAAGFVRNLVWDSIHGVKSTTLNDVDVIYFDPDESRATADSGAIEKLRAIDPTVNWEVTNQALMHIENGDRPYRCSVDAMTYWPEIETAIAVRLNEDNGIEVAAPFGLSSLLSGMLTHNPKRDITIFNDRIRSKCWLSKWPKLRISPQQGNAPDAPTGAEIG